jgi:hypothetical protein
VRHLGISELSVHHLKDDDDDGDDDGDYGDDDKKELKGKSLKIQFKGKNMSSSSRESTEKYFKGNQEINV